MLICCNVIICEFQFVFTNITLEVSKQHNLALDRTTMAIFLKQQCQQKCHMIALYSQ